MTGFKELCNNRLTSILNRLGDEAVITLADASTINIKCVFENNYLLVEDDYGEVGVSSAKPRIVCKSSEVSSVAVNDQISIELINYKVTEIQPDGNGITNLILQKL